MYRVNPQPLMMTSRYGNAYRITNPGFPSHTGSVMRSFCVFLMLAWTSCWTEWSCCRWFGTSWCLVDVTVRTNGAFSYIFYTILVRKTTITQQTTFVDAILYKDDIKTRIWKNVKWYLHISKKLGYWLKIWKWNPDSHYERNIFSLKSWST